MTFDFSSSRAPRTTELYESVWKDWTAFCASIDASALPATAETVLEFLRARERTHSTAALSARKSAIIAAHKDARSRLPDDQRAAFMLEHDDRLKLGWKEILRRKGNRHTPREAVGGVKLKELLKRVPRGPAGDMDRAILLVGLACAMRRSEIAALNRDDIEFTDDAMLVHIRRSKTDQTGLGTTLAAARTHTEACPVAAMERWIEVGQVSDGPLFRHPKFKTHRRIDDSYPYTLVKRYGKAAGYDPKPLGAHSLRRGFVTDVIKSGDVPLSDSMAAARHKTPAIHLGYVQTETATRNPAIRALASVL